MMLILAVIILALIIHSAGRQQPGTVVRDTVTVFVNKTPVADSSSVTIPRPKRSKHHKATTPNRPKEAPTRSPLDEPVPIK